MATFAETYCERYGVTPDRFVDSMFWRCLHRRTWGLVPLLKLVWPDYFNADYELIREVGRLTRAQGLTEELASYHTHPLNGGFARQRLRLRVSVRRVTREVHRLLPGRAPVTFYDSVKPFTAEAGRPAAGEERPPHSASS